MFKLRSKTYDARMDVTTSDLRVDDGTNLARDIVDEAIKLIRKQEERFQRAAWDSDRQVQKIQEEMEIQRKEWSDLCLRWHDVAEVFRDERDAARGLLEALGRARWVK